MGLFSNNKKLCPICGNPTPRLLATKVEGMPICKECDKKIFLPNGAVDNMSLEDFKQYIAYYEGNKELRDSFTETWKYAFGFLSPTMVLDVTHGLFKLKDDANAPALEAACLKSFCISEDGQPLFEGDRNGLKLHHSDVPERVKNLAPQIEDFLYEKRDYERWERMEKMREQQRQNNAVNGVPVIRDTSSSDYRTIPTFDVSAPVRQFQLEIVLDHPYWKNFKETVEAPGFDRYNPSGEDYLRKYQEKVQELHTVASSLMDLIQPGAKEYYDPAEAGAAQNGAAQTGASLGTADEIKKFKDLLDAGVITEEEFAAKKSQLLNL